MANWQPESNAQKGSNESIDEDLYDEFLYDMHYFNEWLRDLEGIQLTPQSS